MKKQIPFYILLIILTGLSSCLDSDTKPIKYSVVYDANGADSGIVPADSTDYEPETRVLIVDNDGNLEKEHCRFNGWNTAADKSGISYEPGSYIDKIEQDITLYVQWWHY